MWSNSWEFVSWFWVSATFFGKFASNSLDVLNGQSTAKAPEWLIFLKGHIEQPVREEICSCRINFHLPVDQYLESRSEVVPEFSRRLRVSNLKSYFQPMGRD